MRVFISWSGDISGKIAKQLADFLEHVVSGLSTFVSHEDIELGAGWEEYLGRELGEAQHAIICITRTNQHKPWISYEAGAIWKGLGSSRVIPYTLGFSPGELLPGPLTRFQGKENNEEGTWAIVKTLNKTLTNQKPERFLEEAFKMWWPGFYKIMVETLSSETIESTSNIPTEREILIEMRQDVARILKHSVELYELDTDSAMKALHRARHDSLTNLGNYESFVNLTKSLAEKGKSYVSALINLDQFKWVNDNYGHAVGDEVLKEFARHLEIALAPAIHIARVGGDEFCAIFVDMSIQPIIKLLHDAQNMTSLVENELQPLTFGAVVCPDGKPLFDNDSAMYTAKHQGRGQVIIAS